MNELSKKIRGELQVNYLHKMCRFCIQNMKPPLTSLTTDSVNNILSLIREEVEKVKGESPEPGWIPHEDWYKACDRILELLEGK